MSQPSSLFCSQCNSPLEPGHRFCTNCGATTSNESNAPTTLSSDQTVLTGESAQSKQAISKFAPGANISADAIPPPPPPDSFFPTPQEAPAAPYYMPPSPGSKSVPTYAQAPKRSRGCLVAGIVLLLLLVLGSIGLFYAFRSRFMNNSNNTNGQQNTPFNIAAGSTGSTGEVLFGMPSGGTAYTLLLLNTPSTTYSQATATFQFQ